VPIVRKHFKLNEKGEWGIYGVFSFSNVVFDNGFTLNFYLHFNLIGLISPTDHREKSE